MALAAATSASGSTIEALSPPISACTGTPRIPAAAATWWPTPTEPVKLTTSARSTSAWPASAPPVTSCRTCLGRKRPTSSTRRTATPLESGAGLSTTVLP